MTAGPLADQVALVTGAGSERGIGFAIARALHGAGATVVIASTSDRIHRRVDQLGTGAHGFVGDLTDPSAVDDMIAATIGLSQRLDIVVNNAGMTSIAAGADAARSLDQLSACEWND